MNVCPVTCETDPTGAETLSASVGSFSALLLCAMFGMEIDEKKTCKHVSRLVRKANIPGRPFCREREISLTAFELADCFSLHTLLALSPS